MMAWLCHLSYMDSNMAAQDVAIFLVFHQWEWGLEEKEHPISPNLGTWTNPFAKKKKYKLGKIVSSWAPTCPGKTWRIIVLIKGQQVNKQWVKEEITQKINKVHWNICKQSTIHQNLWDVVNVVIRRKFTVVNTYI